MLTFALTLRMAELMLDCPSAKRISLRLVLLTIRFVAFNVECITLIVEPVLDGLVEYSFHL
jgi:hypothetical protein